MCFICHEKHITKARFRGLLFPGGMWEFPGLPGRWRAKFMKPALIYVYKIPESSKLTQNNRGQAPRNPGAHAL